jgi:hypothetical protein
LSQSSVRHETSHSLAARVPLLVCPAELSCGRQLAAELRQVDIRIWMVHFARLAHALARVSAVRSGFSMLVVRRSS